MVVASVLVIMLLGAGVGGTVALAQGPTPTPPAQSGAKTWLDLYWQALAQKLGTTVEKLQQMTTEARKDAINQAVKEGLLTRAQADRLLQRQQGLGMLFGDLSRRSARGSLSSAYTAIANAALEAAAKTLGMSTADLTTALRGKTLLDLAREKNVDVTKLRTAIADAEKAAVDQAVKDGTLRVTQAQAESLKANIKAENVDLTRQWLGVAPRGGSGKFNWFGASPRGGFDWFGRWGGRFTGRFGKR
jgi:hypothetical protein